MERDLNSPSPGSARASQRPPSRRTTFVIWLRKAHGWVGLWGATLGLLFGTSGIWLNHRAMLPLQVEQARTNSQLALPDPVPADAATLAAWLQSALQLEAPASNVRVEPARPVAWLERPAHAERAAGRGDGERSRTRERSPVGQGASALPASAASAPSPPVLMQPEHWTINFGGPKVALQAEYWAGNRSVSVRRTQSGLLGTLMNLHKGVGMTVPWILLVDTLAGSLILLSLSGLLLWMLTHRRRVVGMAIFGSALALTAGLAIARL